ncbi:histone lysine methyltransferase SET2 [Besnoitia besnoiti]|uniref:Histone lysine methyltransferase SET2 n=1 Tax=Besnoitia besnoiti TaxID=94643 RepID=A0A2A9MBZ5_BESBE|nr:histone lysine methyltransferase SET2 [Besnoitia besnoiti]PFH33193.1 histone lysine methyltransferase SET2 [Besnoitia besnoiti]
MEDEGGGAGSGVEAARTCADATQSPHRSVEKTETEDSCLGAAAERTGAPPAQDLGGRLEVAREAEGLARTALTPQHCEGVEHRGDALPAVSIPSTDVAAKQYSIAQQIRGHDAGVDLVEFAQIPNAPAASQPSKEFPVLKVSASSSPPQHSTPACSHSTHPPQSSASSADNQERRDQLPSGAAGVASNAHSDSPSLASLSPPSGDGSASPLQPVKLFSGGEGDAAGARTGPARGPQGEPALLRFQRALERVQKEDSWTACALAREAQGALRVQAASEWVEREAERRRKRRRRSGDRGAAREPRGACVQTCAEAGAQAPREETPKDGEACWGTGGGEVMQSSWEIRGRETSQREADLRRAEGDAGRPREGEKADQDGGDERGGDSEGAASADSAYYDSDCDSMYEEAPELEPEDAGVQKHILEDKEDASVSLVDAWRQIQQLCRSVSSPAQSENAAAAAAASSSASPSSSSAALSEEEKQAVRALAFRQLAPRAWNDNLELHCAVCENVKESPHAATMLVCEGYCQRAFHPACVGLGALELDWADEDEPRTRAFSFQCEDCCEDVLRCSCCGLRKPRRQLARCSHMLCRRFFCWPACVENSPHVSPFQPGPLVPSLPLECVDLLVRSRGDSCAKSLLQHVRAYRQEQGPASHGSPASSRLHVSPSASAGPCSLGLPSPPHPSLAAESSALGCAAAVPARGAAAAPEADAARDDPGETQMRSPSDERGDAQTGPKGLPVRAAPALLCRTWDGMKAEKDANAAEDNRLLEAARILYDAGDEVFFDAQGRERFICSHHFCVSCHTLELQHFTWETHLRQLAQLADELQLHVPRLTADASPAPATAQRKRQSAETSVLQSSPSGGARRGACGGRPSATAGFGRRGLHVRGRRGCVGTVGGARKCKKLPARAGAPDSNGDSSQRPDGDEEAPQDTEPDAAEEASPDALACRPLPAASASSAAAATRPSGEAASVWRIVTALEEQISFARACLDFVKESTRGWTDKRIFAKQYKFSRPDPFPSLLLSPLVDIWACELCRTSFCSRCVPPAAKILNEASGSILCDFCRFSASVPQQRRLADGLFGRGDGGEARRARPRGTGGRGHAGDDWARSSDGGAGDRRRKRKRRWEEEERKRIADVVKEVLAGADCVTSLTTNLRRFLSIDSASPAQNPYIASLAVRVIDEAAWESCAILEDEESSEDLRDFDRGKAKFSASSPSPSEALASSLLAGRSAGAKHRQHAFALKDAFGEREEEDRDEGKLREKACGEKADAGEWLKSHELGSKRKDGSASSGFGADRLNFQFTTSCICATQCRNLLRAPRTEGEICVCTGSRCDADCLNRSRGIQCDRKRCKFGPADCGNRQFKRGGGSGSQAFCFVQDCGEKGLGVFARERIEEGKLVIEYVGEVLDSQLLAARVRAYTRQELARGQPQHWYVMEVIPGVYIDSTRVGNIARLVNHSCEPNCSLQRVNVHGTYRMGIFALRTILPGEEISYDYGFTRKGFGQGFICFCGSTKCRGRIGGDSRRNKFADVADNALKRKEGFDALLCRQLCQVITSQSFSRAERIPPPSPYTWRRDGVGTSFQAREWLEKKLVEGEADNPFFAQFIFDFHLYDAAVNFVKLLLLDGKTVEEFARSKTKSLCMDIPWSLLASDFNDKGMTQATRHSILTEERLNKAKKFFLSNMAVRAAAVSGRSAQTALQDLVDLNWGATEMCSLCDSEGVVSVCDSCAEAYHADCAELSQDDEGHSLCPACLLSDSRRQWHLMSEAERVHVGVRLNALRLLETLAKSPFQEKLFARREAAATGDAAEAPRDKMKVEKGEEDSKAALLSKGAGRSDTSKKGGKVNDRLGSGPYEKGKNGAAGAERQISPVFAGLHVNDIWSAFTLQDEEEASFFEAGYLEE